MSPSTFTFDRQAADFDLRAGLPEVAVRRIVATVVDLVEEGAEARFPAGPVSAGRTSAGHTSAGHTSAGRTSAGHPSAGRTSAGRTSTVLDLGAGTGEIGERLAPRLAAGGWGYLAVDLSLPMLATLRRRAAVWALRADADRPWPVAAGCLRAVFASRAAHLLAPRRLVEQSLRALGCGGLFLLGGLRRDPGSVRSELRRRLHALLEERGIEPRRRGPSWRRLEGLFTQRGCRTSRRTVASWTGRQSPAAALRAWRGKDGLAGRGLSSDLHGEVMERLESWTRERFQDLETARPVRECYEMLIVRQP